MNSISNIEIAIMALYWLGGVDRKVHLEEIAVKCHELAPGRFGFELKKYKNFPDKKVAYESLSDARKEKHGGLVKSSGARSLGGSRFQITKSGVEWVKAHGDRIAEALKVNSLVMHKKAAERIRRNLTAAKTATAFQKFHEGKIAEISIYELMNALDCPFETSPGAIWESFARKEAEATDIDDADFLKFLSSCKPHLTKLLYA